MSSSNAPSSPAPQRRKIRWWWYVIGGFAVLFGVATIGALMDRSTFNEGHAAYQNGNCDEALAKFNKVLEHKKDDPSEPREYVKAARKEKTECIAFKAALDKQASAHPSAALLAFIEFAIGNKGSALMSFAQGQFKSLLDKNPPGKLADASWCSKAPELPALGITPQPETYVPPLLLACGRQLENTRAFRVATQVYESFLDNYPKDPKLNEAKAGLARTLVADAKAQGAGNLPDPQRSGNAAGNATVVVIKNSSPNRIRLAMTGAESRLEELLPCEKCERFTASNVPQDCPKEGTIGRYSIKPGQYEVVVVSSDNKRVTPFKGTWQLNAGGEYFNCFYIVTRKTFTN